MSNARDFVGQGITAESVIMPDEADITPVINVRGVTIKTLYIPAAFIGSKLTFDVSYDGITFFPYYNINDEEVSTDITAGRAYGLGAIDLLSIKFCKIKSDAAQTADKTIYYDIISI